jgi:hypothetical protein
VPKHDGEVHLGTGAVPIRPRSADAVGTACCPGTSSAFDAAEDSNHRTGSTGSCRALQPAPGSCPADTRTTLRCAQETSCSLEPSRTHPNALSHTLAARHPAAAGSPEEAAAGLALPGSRCCHPGPLFSLVGSGVNRDAGAVSLGLRIARGEWRVRNCE